jgi:molecular chaperone DnaJ
LGLTFEEAVFGAQKELEIPRWESCLICGGSGAEPGKPPIRCPQCGGAGEVRRVQQSIFGQFVNVTACDRCRGTGQIVQARCPDCGGGGRVRRTRKIPLTIPAGVDSGTEMRVPGQGEGGDRGGPGGDLYVQFQVEAHPVLRREGFDLVYELPLNVAQAALGAEVRVPTLEGDEVLRVPPGTQHGRVFRIREKGVPRLQRSGRGDFRIVARITVPKDLTPRQRELLTQLARTFDPDGPDRHDGAAGGRTGASGAAAPSADGASGGGQAPRGRPPRSKGILDKMKDALGLEEE